MSRFEAEPRVVKPCGFETWLRECGEVADVLGAWALIGVWFSSTPDQCAYLLTIPGMWEGLLARGRYADRCRYDAGVYYGRRATNL